MVIILNILIGAAIAVFIWLAAREWIMWYYKINERLETLKRIERLLEKIESKL